MTTFWEQARPQVTLAGTALAAMPGQAAAHAQDGGDWSGFYARRAGRRGARPSVPVQATDTLNQHTANINPPGAQPLHRRAGAGSCLCPAGTVELPSFMAARPAGSFQSGPGGVRHRGRSPQPAAPRWRSRLRTRLPSPRLRPGIHRHAGPFGPFPLRMVDPRARIGYATGNTMFIQDGGVAGAHVRVRGDSSYTIPAGDAGCPDHPAVPGAGAVPRDGIGNARPDRLDGGPRHRAKARRRICASGSRAAIRIGVQPLPSTIRPRPMAARPRRPRSPRSPAKAPIRGRRGSA